MLGWEDRYGPCRHSEVKGTDVAVAVLGAEGTEAAPSENALVPRPVVAVMLCSVYPKTGMVSGTAQPLNPSEDAQRGRG